MEQMKKVGIFLFDGVEIMDFAGPYEVFTVVNLEAPQQYFEVFSVSESKGEICTSNGLTVNTHYGFDDCPQVDILVIPGGNVRPEIMANEDISKWIAKISAKTEITLSVCNGAMLLAKAGLLQGLPATTHGHFLNKLAELDATVDVKQNVRFVDTGKIITAAGISAGIDVSLHVVSRLFGESAVSQAIKIMEYESKAYQHGMIV